MPQLSQQQIAWIAEMTGVDEATIAANAGAIARQGDILDEFDQSQSGYGRQQAEIDDGPADPDLDEPGRMPELDPGPEPARRYVKLSDIKYTQNDVSPRMGDGTSMDEVSESMAREGWDPNAPNPEMVQGADGRTMTTLDHRRLVAADHAGLDEVPADVYAPDAPLPEDYQERFKLRRKFTDPETETTYPKDALPEDWAEAAKFRAANQKDKPALPGDESYEFPPGGDKRPPWLKADKATPQAGAKPSLSGRADDALRRFQEDHPAARRVVEEFDRAEAARRADLDPESAFAEASAPAPVAEEPVPVSEPPAASKAPSARAGAAADAEAAAGAEAGLGGAVKGGLLGAGIAGGMALADDWDRVKSGKMSVGDAAVDVGGKAVEAGGLTFAGTAVADAAVGGGGAEAAAVAAGGRALAGAAGGEAGAVAGSLAGVAAKGGVIGGVVAGGMALIDDVGKVRSGAMTGGTATADVTAKTAVGVGAGLAGAAAGAEIGAAVGTAIPIPIVGTAAGLVAGAVIGGAVGYVGNKLMNTETGQAIIHGAGQAVDAAIDGVEAAGTFVAEEAGAAAETAEAVVEHAEHLAAEGVDAAVKGAGKAARKAEELAQDAGHAIAEGAGAVADGVGKAADVVEGAAGEAEDAVEGAVSSAWGKVTSLL